MRFDPNQPRIPAGAPGAGQWTSGGEGVSPSNASSDAEAGDPLFDGSDTAEGSPDAPLSDSPSGTIIGTAPDGTPIVAVADSSPSNRYNIILEEEDARGGHIQDHIGTTDEEMKDILSRRVYRLSNLFGLTVVIFDKRFGSFDNRNSATELINKTIQISKESTE